MLKDKRLKKKSFLKITFLVPIIISLIIIFILFLGIILTTYTKPMIAIVHYSPLYDNSFNEQAVDAINHFDNYLAKNDYQEIEHVYIETKEDYLELTNAYYYLIDNDFQIMIAMGWLNEMPLLNVADLIEGTDQYIIYVDDEYETFGYNHTTNTDLYQNIISLHYEAEESAFIAGFISAMYVVTYFEPGSWLIGAWGGYGTSLSIMNYLAGFQAGIDYFNILFHNFVPTIPSTQNVELIPPFPTARDPLDIWYTHSWTAGDGITAANNLIDQGAKVIFPIAGSQTIDVINVIYLEGLQDEIKIVAPDVDGRIQYPDSADLFLTSATKNIEKSIFTIIMLWYQIAYLHDDYQLFSKIVSSRFIQQQNYRNGGVGYAYDSPEYEPIIEPLFIDFQTKYGLSFLNNFDWYVDYFFNTYLIDNDKCIPDVDPRFTTNSIYLDMLQTSNCDSSHSVV